jgi:hypothetical protein
MLAAVLVELVLPPVEVLVAEEAVEAAVVKKAEAEKERKAEAVLKKIKKIKKIRSRRKKSVKIRLIFIMM